MHAPSALAGTTARPPPPGLSSTRPGGGFVMYPRQMTTPEKSQQDRELEAQPQVLARVRAGIADNSDFIPGLPPRPERIEEGLR